MRVGVSYLISLTLFLLLSCQSSENEVNRVAEQFLDSFFKFDYESAKALSTHEYKEELSFLTKSIEGLEQGVRDKVIEYSQGVERELLNIEKSNSKDTLILNYRMVAPNTKYKANNSLTMVKGSEGWRVARFGS